MKAPARGFAVPVLLLLLLALTALAHGALLLALAERRASVALGRVWESGQAARAAVLLTLGRMVEGAGERLPWTPEAGAAGETEEGLRYRSTLLWLDREFFLLEGVGGTLGWEGERRVGWVGWVLDPAARLGAFRGVVEVGGGVAVEVGGRLDNRTLDRAPEDWPHRSCAHQAALFDSLFPGGYLSAQASLDVVSDGAGTGSNPLPSLGLLTGDHLRLLGEGDGMGAGPVPTIPDGLGSPPGSAPGLSVARGTLTLSGERRFGLLAVEGDLVLRDQSRVQGLALVSGDLVLEGTSIFEGLARVGGHIHVGGGSLLRGSACAVFRALDGLSELHRPLIPPGGTRLTAF